MPVAETESTTKARGGRGPLIIALIVGLIVLVGGFAFWRHSLLYESTDDAQVDGHLVGIESRIAGTITAVNFEANQAVSQGQVMAEIDPRDYQVALEEAKASVAQADADIQVQHPNIPITETSGATSIAAGEAEVRNARAAVAGAERDLAAAEARLREAEANNAKAQADVARYRALVDKDEVPREQYDSVTAQAQALQAQVDFARASAEAAQKTVDQRHAQQAEAESRFEQADRNAPRQVAVSRATLVSKQAAALVARARMDRALLDLSYTKVLAPAGGVVGRRDVEAGNTVQAGQELFSLTRLDDLWVTANFKETQLRRMRPGLRVEIKADVLDAILMGRVESMPGATGAVLSLLPPENATGNYVKVVQRLPVRIRFEPNQKGLERLRPGMSVEPKVWLR
jgi:membrane fusion protein (multidrug efflux system)